MAELGAEHRTRYNTSHGKAVLVFYNEPSLCGGTCRYCILDPGFTKSTVRNQDTLLAKNCDWDPTCQIDARFRQYGLSRGLGYKYGLAVKGDSFTNHDPEYLKRFFKALYDYLNGTESHDFDESRWHQRDGADRCVWVQAETRPDMIDEEWCDRLLELGVNAVELGVQSLDDDVLRLNRRGHGVAAVRAATRLLRDRGFDVGYHLMVGLPGATDELDYQLLTERLWEPDYAPDCLKIYPCILLKNHKLQPQLARLAAGSTWNALTDERYLELLNAVLPRIPPTASIHRIQRMMPPEDIDLGPRRPIDRGMFDGVSRCLWQRAIGRATPPVRSFENYTVRSTRHGPGYCVEATLRSGEVLLGYGRFAVGPQRAGLVRDLRVLGEMVPVGASVKSAPQHTGIGKAMVREMERLALAHRCTVLRVQPPAGSFRYFEPLGFRKVNRYQLEKRLAGAPTDATR